MYQLENAFDDRSVLIVGGAGFVGSNLLKYLLKSSPSVRIHVIDNLLSAEASSVPEDSRVSMTVGSISDDRIVGALEDRYDYIFHLATYHGNQSSIHDPLADHENNTLTSLKLFEHIKEFKKLRALVYSGAGCAVADKTFDQARATKEGDLVSLTMDSPYSISKIIGEFYAKYYFRQHGLPVVRARFQNVYGPGEILGAGKWRGTPATVWRNVTPTFVYKSLMQQELPLENGGQATRDFIYVDDIVRGLMHCALWGSVGDVYNLASGKEISIRELAELINQLTENPTPACIKPARDWDRSGCRYGCPEKAAEQMGFRTKVSLEEGLRHTIEWTKTHLDKIQMTMTKHRQHLPELCQEKVPLTQAAPR